MQLAVFVAGPPGAGKSSLARIVARHLRAALIDSDALYGPLTPHLSAADPQLVREALYDGLVETVAMVTSVGVPAVVVAPFTRERADASAWERIRTRARAAGAQAVLVWVHAPVEVLLERLAERGLERDAAKLSDPVSWLDQARPEVPPAVAHLAVDGTLPVQAAAEALLAELAALGLRS